MKNVLIKFNELVVGIVDILNQNEKQYMKLGLKIIYNYKKYEKNNTNKLWRIRNLFK